MTDGRERGLNLDRLGNSGSVRRRLSSAPSPVGSPSPARSRRTHADDTFTFGAACSGPESVEIDSGSRAEGPRSNRRFGRGASTWDARGRAPSQSPRRTARRPIATATPPTHAARRTRSHGPNEGSYTAPLRRATVSQNVRASEVIVGRSLAVAKPFFLGPSQSQSQSDANFENGAGRGRSGRMPPALSLWSRRRAASHRTAAAGSSTRRGRSACTVQPRSASREARLGRERGCQVFHLRRPLPSSARRSSQTNQQAATPASSSSSNPLTHSGRAAAVVFLECPVPPIHPALLLACPMVIRSRSPRAAPRAVRKLGSKTPQRDAAL